MTDPVRPVAPREVIRILTAINKLRLGYRGGREQLDKEEVLAIFQRQGCACRCCDHAEGSDCACDCHAIGDCSAAAPVPCAASPTDEGRLEFIRGVIEDTLADGPRPSTKHQLERALRAIRIELTRLRNGARDDHADMQSPVDRPGGATDSTCPVVAGHRPASARDEAGQALPLQQLRGSAENADAAPVAVSLDPHRLTFAGFSEANRQRCEDPQGFGHALSSWSTSDWFVAIMGELGEAANIVKKLNRYRDGVRGNKESEAALRAKLRSELADSFIYLDLIFQACRFDTVEAVIDTFDAKSAEIGYPARLRGEATVRVEE
jgi:NTP pyrophosphatase (non-canonical NTP hydrolase)